jgi:hypothetical protein
VEQEEVEELQIESSVINASANSHNMVQEGEEVNQNIIINPVLIQWNSIGTRPNFSGLDIIDAYQSKLTARFYGPVLPPQMQCEKFLCQFVPKMAAAMPPMGFSTLSHFQFIMQGGPFEKGLLYPQSRSALGSVYDVSPFQLQYRQVTCQLQFEEQDNTGFAAMPDLSAKRKRGARKKAVPLVDTSVRRSTRSSAKNNGHRHVVLPDPRGQASKKRKVQRKLIQDEIIAEKEQEQSEEGDKMGMQQKEDCTIPSTPLKVMQQVGLALGMDAAQLTKEKLMAAPDSPTTIKK